jgi:hypothetical protein
VRTLRVAASRSAFSSAAACLATTSEHGRLAAARLEQERRTGNAEMGAESPIPDLYEVLAQL